MGREEMKKAEYNFTKAIHHLKTMILCGSLVCKIARVEEGFESYNQIFRMALKLNRMIEEEGIERLHETDLEKELKMHEWHKENFPELYKQ